MRYMLIVRADEAGENGVPKARKLEQAMGKFNEDMVRGGVLLAAEGLTASWDATRIKFTDGKRTLTDGPFHPREVISGFWLIQVRSREEALEWASRCPFANGELELRKVVE